MTKKNSTKVVRKSLKEKLAEARVEGLREGHAQGVADKVREFQPHYFHKKNVNDFVRMIESWGSMSENGVIMIAGTDLKAHCTGAVPLRLFRVIAEELTRLGYSSGPVRFG